MVARIGSTGRSLQQGPGSYTESTAYDWAGRTTRVTDTYGRNIQSAYDDDDRLTGITDLAQNQAATYSYDVRGLKTGERLSRGGAVLHDQINSYNGRGWLAGVDTGATLSFGGSSLSQPVKRSLRMPVVCSAQHCPPGCDPA